MRKKDFDELLSSVRQAGKIRRGEAEPSRVNGFRAEQASRTPKRNARKRHSGRSRRPT
jgi:hypothetical protein